jgi:alpha-L-rhamnosidase
MSFQCFNQQFCALLVFSAAIFLTSFAAQAAGAELSITNAGAVGDGMTLNTTAIQNTIDRLATNGGGTVVIPPGKFLSGAIFLKPGVNLHLDKDAVLEGSTCITNYPAMQTRIEGHFQVWIPALVNGSNVDHVRISGEGTIQGGGKPYWDAFWNRVARDDKPKNLGRVGVRVIPTKNLDVNRPRNIFIQDSKDVQLSGISLRQSGFWNLHLFRCSDVLIENMSITTTNKAPSTDGIDLDSCQHVTVSGCYISVDDDCIALKGNKGTSALDDKTIPPDEHICVTNCTFGLGNSALTLGSEATLVRDVVIENCMLTGTNSNCILKLKMRTDTPQHYENITARNITSTNLSAQMISIQGWSQYFDLQGKPAPSQLATNITLENITGAMREFGVVDGPKKSTVVGLTFKDITLALTNSDLALRGVKSLKMENVNITLATKKEKSDGKKKKKSSSKTTKTKNPVKPPANADADADSDN